MTIVAKEEKGKIVQIVAQSENQTSLGSGFWIGGDGYIATCYHVVFSNTAVKIIVRSAIDSIINPSGSTTIYANWEIFDASVVAIDPVHDVAIIKTSTNPLSAPPHALMSINGQSLSAHYSKADIDISLPQAGEAALIAGYPLGQPYLVFQQATVAADAVINSSPKILLSAVANHGNSGGPVLNDKGNVIGLLEGELPGQQNERTGIELVVPVYFADVLLKSIQPPH